MNIFFLIITKVKVIDYFLIIHKKKFTLLQFHLKKEKQ